MWTDLIQPVIVWLNTGDIRALLASPAAAALAFILPSTIVGLGIGLMEWRETALAAWLGMGGPSRDENWTERARDLDKDGLPDF